MVQLKKAVNHRNFGKLSGQTLGSERINFLGKEDILLAGKLSSQPTDVWQGNSQIIGSAARKSVGK